MICNQCPRSCKQHHRKYCPDINAYPGISSPDPFHYCGKNGDDISINVAKHMVHHWEEPCISGDKGSGAVFFAGCNLGCVFCQNFEISRHDNSKRKSIGIDELENSIYKLAREGCHNIDFITGSHLTGELMPLMKKIKERFINNSLKLPFIWNSSAYETTTQIKLLENLIDVYLPDLKYYSSELSENLCNAPDYFDFACKAIIEMARQKPYNIYSDDGKILTEGVMIRHLVLPGFYKDSIKIIEWIEANLSNSIKLSLLSQYIPDYFVKYCNKAGKNGIYSDSLKRKLTTYEYEKVVDKAISLGFSDVYIQEKGCASIEFVPIF